MGLAIQVSGQTFETRNVAVAAFLNYAGLVHIETVRVGEKSCLFLFDDPDNEAEALEKDFFANRGVTSARELLEADREIRRSMYDAKKV